MFQMCCWACVYLGLKVADATHFGSASNLQRSHARISPTARNLLFGVVLRSLEAMTLYTTSDFCRHVMSGGCVLSELGRQDRFRWWRAQEEGGLARCGACLSLFRARGAVVDRTFAAPAAVGRTPMTKIQQRGAPDHFRHVDSQIRGQGLLTQTQPPFPCFLTF
jgi:hypothetical protein